MSTAAHSKKIFKKNPGFVPRNIAGELVLIPVQKELRKVNSIYTLNEMGASIWELVDGKTSNDQIKESLLNRYEVSAEQLDRDLEELTEQLLEIQALIKV